MFSDVPPIVFMLGKHVCDQNAGCVLDIKTGICNVRPNKPHFNNQMYIHMLEIGLLLKVFHIRPDM